MKLSEIVKELTTKKDDGSRIYTQETLAKALGTNQPAIGQILGAKAWDSHWEVFLKLLPIAAEYGLAEIPAQKLKPLTAEELLYGQKTGSTTSSNDPACQSRTKTAGSGIVSTGGIAKRKKTQK